MAQKAGGSKSPAKAESLKLFGLPAESGRWIFVVLGLIINLCMGSVYAWSVFRKPLEKEFGVVTTQSALPFIIFLACFALSMLFTGRLMDKLGPKMLMIIGSVMVGLGWILSSWASNIVFMCLTYGVIAGFGVGIVYGGPIAVSNRWFPDKKGLAVGLTVGGFGLSALITAPLANFFITSVGLRGFGGTFFWLGLIFLIVMVLLSLPMKFPVAGWKPAGWSPKVATGTTAAVDLTMSATIKTSSFWGLWLCYIIGCLGGLMAIGIASPAGQDIIKLPVAIATILVSVFAIFNGVGRPLFGWLTDKMTPKYAAVLSFVLICLASLGMLFAGEGKSILFAVCFCGFYLAFGGWLAIAPTSTATFFGSKNYSQIYGVVFTAYGLGAIIGNLTQSMFKDAGMGYTPSFILTGILGIVGIVLALVLLKPPKTKS